MHKNIWKYSLIKMYKNILCTVYSIILLLSSSEFLTLNGTLEIRRVGFFGLLSNFSDLLLIGDKEYGDQGSFMTTERSEASNCIIYKK